MRWKIRRGETEYEVSGTPALVQYARSGRIAATDYVFNPTLNQWQIAKDVPELQGSLRAPSNPVGTPAQLGCLGAVMLVAGPAIGGGLLNSLGLSVVGLALGVLFIVAAIVIALVRR